jgi:type I restriction enzyme S subunit
MPVDPAISAPGPVYIGTAAGHGLEECHSTPPDAGISFVPMPAVSDVTGEIETPQAKRFSEVSRGYTRFELGDVIFAKITPCMENGKIAVARNLINDVACGSTEFHVLRPMKGISV